MRKPKKKIKSAATKKMHADDILNNQFQLRFSSRITALEIQPVAFET